MGCDHLKIEKINENQIRCTLNSEDLSEMQINLNDLAYGSEKARRLFSDLLEKAAAEVGFETENIPLMVEAIPLNAETIMLIVTRVEDPDELDARFSRFSPYAEDDEKDDNEEGPIALLEGAADLMLDAGPAPSSRNEPDPSYRIFTFDSLDQAASAAAALHGSVLNGSALYKDPGNGNYYLCVHLSNEPDSFRRICNTLTEYGTIRRNRPASLAYCDEHCEIIIASIALEKLARLM